MYTRNSRRPRSSGGSGGGGGSAYYQVSPGSNVYRGSSDAMAGVMPTLTSSSPASDVHRSRSDRPSSAPAPPSSVITSDELAHVEQRLKIIKRNRSSRHKAAAAAAVIPIAGLTEGAVASIPYQSPVQRAQPVEPQEPPCSAYPTFSHMRIPKHEQHVMEAMVGECLDILLFPGAMQDY